MQSRQSLLNSLISRYGREAVAKALQSSKPRFQPLPEYQPHQVPPDLTGKDGWLFLAGRGAGKSAAAVIWLLSQPVKYKRIIAPTFSVARDVLAEGPSGVKTLAPDRIEIYNRSIGEFKMKDGSEIKLLSAERPDKIRGSQSEADLYDELVAWEYDTEAYEMARFGLRLGSVHKFVAATSPAPTKLIRDLVNDRRIAVTRAATRDNQFLPQSFIESIYEKYGNSALGRQELQGELLEDMKGALWTYNIIENTRASTDMLTRIVIGVDPKTSAAGSASETGIIVSGSTAAGHYYVLDDVSNNGSPQDWSEAVVKAYYQYNANLIVAEANQGGSLVEAVLRNIAPNLPIKLVHASKGKYTRAEPISLLYERGLVHHTKLLSELETQMISWVPGNSSPDRLDALVWSLTELSAQEEMPVVYNYQYANNPGAASNKRR